MATIEIYTLGTGWAAPATLNPMHKARTLLAASLLDDGDVLAVGGYNNADGMVLDSERYDLATGTWTLGTGHLRRGRNDATATLLLDGRVLVAGGADLQRSHADGEIYDPTTTSFEWVYGAANARTLGHTAHRMDGDRVLVVGGWYTEGLRILSECDIYDRDVDAGPPPPEEPDADPDGGHSRPDGGPRPRDAGADASGAPDGGEPPPPLGPTGDGAYGATGGCRTSVSGDDAWPLALLGALAWVTRRRRSPRAPSDAMATRRPFR